MMDSEPALTLANTPLYIQITICLFLHPSDILALHKGLPPHTTQGMSLINIESFVCLRQIIIIELVATRKRIVWVSALHRACVCLDSTLFLPSSPIPDMTDLELERAAMFPHRWIELCAGRSIPMTPATRRLYNHELLGLLVIRIPTDLFFIWCQVGDTW